MIAIDTNIIVRLLTQDDLSQYKKAYNLLNKYEVFITETVILETEWVLRFAYDYKVDQIANALIQLLGLPNVHINHPERVAQAIAWHSKGLDFADALHLANSQHCKEFFTFDKKMINAAKRIDKLNVHEPI